MRVRTGILFGSLALLPTIASGQQATPETITDPAVYEVYRALAWPRNAVVVGRTITGSCVGAQEWPDQEFRPLVERLRTVVAQPMLLVPELVPGYRLMMWTDSKCCDLEWSQFQGR